jgi:hypothetical protein
MDGKAAGRAARRARAGVPLTSSLLEWGVPTHEADCPVVPLDGEQVKGSRDNPAWSIGIAVVVGINGVLGKDIRVLYPLVVLRSNLSIRPCTRGCRSGSVPQGSQQPSTAHPCLPEGQVMACRSEDSLGTGPVLEA